MDVRCEECGTEYEFDQNRIGPTGVTVKCTQCGHVFKVHRPDRRRRPIPRQSSALGAPQGREWLVRHPDRRMVAFRELTTLQKWIVEGRINRDDEISKNGETWKRLGNIAELEPFFSVYEKAQTLNQMVEHGAPIAPVSVRGTDVLASVHPVAPSSNIGVAPLSNIGYAPMTSIGPTSSLEHHPVAGPVQPMLPPPIPPATQPAIPAQPTQRPAHLSDVRPAEERPAFGTSKSPNFGTSKSPSASGSFPGPAAINNEPVPAAFGTSSLDLPAQLTRSSSDPVADFKKTQRRQTWAFAVALLLFLAIGVAAG
ncbi:MAG: zinc-ribbon domain-containing protein, partial [Myxococcota bacterium]